MTDSFINAVAPYIGSLFPVFVTVLITLFLSSKEIKERHNKLKINIEQITAGFILATSNLPTLHENLKNKNNFSNYQDFFEHFWKILKELWEIKRIGIFPFETNPFPFIPMHSLFSQINRKIEKESDVYMHFLLSYSTPEFHDQLKKSFDDLSSLMSWLAKVKIFFNIMCVLTLIVLIFIAVDVVLHTKNNKQEILSDNITNSFRIMDNSINKLDKSVSSAIHSIQIVNDTAKQLKTTILKTDSNIQKLSLDAERIDSDINLLIDIEKNKIKSKK